VPSGLPSGCCSTVEVDFNSNKIASGPMSVSNSSPGFFSYVPGPNPNNQAVGWALGWTDGSYTPVGIAIYNADSGQSVVDLTSILAASPGTGVYLELLGTGMRHALTSKVTIGGTVVPARIFTDPQFEGMDQLQVGPLPASLAGAGLVNIVLTTDAGSVSNTVALMIQ
jgi:uncharacterized protein (TIGR03437 family)